MRDTERKQRRFTFKLLVELVGAETARRIAIEWGGHAVPSYSAAERAARDRAIRAAIDAGASYGQAARHFGVSRTHAARIASVPQ